MAVRRNIPNKWHLSNGSPSNDGFKRSSLRSKSFANLSVGKLRDNSPVESQRRFSGGNLPVQASKNKSYSPGTLSRERSPVEIQRRFSGGNLAVQPSKNNSYSPGTLSRENSNSPVDVNRRLSGGNLAAQALKNKSISTRSVSSGNLAILALKRQAFKSSSNLSLDMIDIDEPHPGRKLSGGSLVASGLRQMSNTDWRNSTGDLSVRSRSSSTRRSSSIVKDESRESSPATRRPSTDLTSSPKRERTRKKGATNNSDFIEKSNSTNSLSIAADIVKSIALSQEIVPLKDNDLSKGGVKETPLTQITERVVFTYLKFMFVVFVIIMVFKYIGS